MSYDLSDEEFCETNFLEPSPLKKTKSLLPSAKEWNEKLEKRVEFRNKVQQAESEFLSFFENKLTKKDEKQEIPKNPEGNNLALIKANNPGNEIKLFPEGRPFFEKDASVNDSLEPSLWFNDYSVYSSRSLEDFLRLVKQGLLLSRSKFDIGEDKQLRIFCLKILKVEKDILTASLLLQFLSSKPFPFDMVNLKNWNSPYFSKLLGVLEKSISRYSAKECQKLFREGCLAALDHETFSYSHVFSSFLAACLQISTNELPVYEEIDWLSNLELLPEESFHILKILPQCGDLRGIGLQFASRVIQKLFKEPYSLKCLCMSDILSLLKTNDLKIKSFSMNEVFHFLNILNYIILRLPMDPESHASLEEVICSIESFKLHYQREKGVTFYVVNECINRICLTMKQRVPSHRETPIEIQCRKKLFILQ